MLYFVSPLPHFHETSFDPICSQLASLTQMCSPWNQGSRYKTHHTTTASTQTDPSCRTRWAGRPSSVSLPYSSLVLLTVARALAPYLRMEIQVPIDSFGNTQKRWLFRAQHWRVPHGTPGTVLVLCQPQHHVFGQDAFQQKQRSHQTLLLVWCLLLSGCWKWARKWARNHRTSSSPSPKALLKSLLFLVAIAYRPIDRL